MHICIMTTTFPRTRDDFAGQFVLGYARSLVAAGADVTVIAPHDRDAQLRETVDGVRIRRFRYWWPASAQRLCYGAGIPTNIRKRKWLAAQLPVLEAGFLNAALASGRAVDVYNPHWTFAGVAAVLAAKLTRKPVVTTAYSAEYVPASLRKVNRRIVNNSEAVISISKFTYDKVEETVTPRQHHVIGYGVNPEKIAPDDFDVAAFRQERRIGRDDFLVFAVGRLVARKGYPVLIEAIRRLKARGQRVRLLLAGTGPDRTLLEQHIAQTGIGGVAQLLGFISDEDLRYFLRAADVLVMPSIADQTGDTEGLGIPLLEAMINGTPVIASDIGGIVDIVADRQTGLLVPPGDADALADAIAQLAQDGDLRQRLVTAGYALVNGKFSWESIAHDSLRVFENVLSAPR